MSLDAGTEDTGARSGRGRPEGSLDPDVGPVASLAHELRLLRKRAGTPSYRELARRTHYSVSALSQAAAGHTLPTLAVLRAFVTGCGGDPTEWEARWQAAAAAEVREPAAAGTGRTVTVSRAAPAVGDAATFADAGGAVRPAPDDPAAAPPATPPPAAGDDPPHPRGARAWRSRHTLAGLLAGVAIGCLLTLALQHAWPSRARPAPAATGGHSAVVDGADPTHAGCGPDAVTIASVPVSFPVPQHSGTLQLRYSPRCHAAWARFDPDVAWHPPAGTVVVIATLRPDDQASQDYAVPFGGQAIIGNVLLTGHGCVAAQLTMTSGSVTSPTAGTKCAVIEPGR